jgi:hypothetical protein
MFSWGYAEQRPERAGTGLLAARVSEVSLNIVEVRCAQQKLHPKASCDGLTLKN